MTAAIWITPPDTCAMDFPARLLIKFLYNHQLLQVFNKPRWSSIEGGRYILVPYDFRAQSLNASFFYFG
jgi:predicted NAD/FAD-binding protein